MLFMKEYYTNKLNLFKDIYGQYKLKKNKFAVHPEKFNINIETFNKSYLYNKNNHIQTIFNFTWVYSHKSNLINGNIFLYYK